MLIGRDVCVGDGGWGKGEGGGAFGNKRSCGTILPVHVSFSIWLVLVVVGHGRWIKTERKKHLIKLESSGEHLLG